MFFVNFKDKKKVDHIFENSLDVQSFLDALHATYYQLSELEDFMILFHEKIMKPSFF